MSRSAPRLSLRNKDSRRLIVAGLVALALLALGEAAPGAFPVQVSIEGHGTTLLVSVDGQQHEVPSTLGPHWRGIRLDQPGPLEREYQIDGSDTTSTGDRQPSVISALIGTPQYQVDAWLRDESSYSRWDRVVITDLATGQPISSQATLPADFRIDAALRRPESAAHLWLLGAGQAREGLELDRDKRNARWLIQRDGSLEALPRWFFPEQAPPFVVELLHMLGRSVAAAYGLTLGAVALAALARRLPPIGALTRAGDLVTGRSTADLMLCAWLLGAALVTTRLYRQLPHILDAVSYTFQASLFSVGKLTLPAPPLAPAFKGPFQILWHGQVFSQYPPGAPALYAAGQVVHLEWLVGPLACLALIATTSWTAGALYGRVAGLTALVLGALSPFVLFQAGSFLSHPVAGGLLACALAAFVKAERDRAQRWIALSGLFLGMAFLTREAASVLFAIPLGVRLLSTRNTRAMGTMAAAGLPFVAVYLLYNSALTGSPALLPRMLFDPSDHFGFGDGVGFHTRHTLAAGLVNTDELLTILQLDLFGWPPFFTLGLLAVPFLVGRPRLWDYLAALGFLACVVVYVGYFYHGIALGPRYYFEAVPWLLLLAGRGAHALAEFVYSRVAVAVVLGLLSLNTLFFYLPLEIERRVDLSGLPGGRTFRLAFVEPGLLGPQLDGVPTPSLVLTADWWLFNTGLAPLNCPNLPECPVLFALATNRADENALRAQFPGRTVLRTSDDNGRISLTPA